MGGIKGKSSGPRSFRNDVAQVIARCFDLFYGGYVPSRAIIINAWLRYAPKDRFAKHRSGSDLKGPSHYQLFSVYFK